MYKMFTIYEYARDSLLNKSDDSLCPPPLMNIFISENQSENIPVYARSNENNLWKLWNLQGSLTLI